MYSIEKKNVSAREILEKWWISISSQCICSTAEIGAFDLLGDKIVNYTQWVIINHFRELCKINCKLVDSEVRSLKVLVEIPPDKINGVTWGYNLA